LSWGIVKQGTEHDAETGLPREITDRNSGIEMVLIPAGSFMMGATPNDRQAEDDEGPRHRVTILRPFYLGKYEVTQEEWTRVVRCNPSGIEDPKYPVMGVNRRQVSAFLSRTGLRLPREEEWEYACRAGREEPRYGDLWEIARHLGNSCDLGGPGGPSEVGSYLPNAFGLCDMLGNAEELCQGAYAAYKAGEVVVGKAPNDPVLGVKRGGGFLTSSHLCRASSRRPYSDEDDGDLIVLGFRVARDP
jgi:formylglycine-generating enzyme required for sulfatase activity